MLWSRRRRQAREGVATRPAVGRAHGRALLAYLRTSVELDDAAAQALTGHPNQWESRQFAVALSELGFDVDAIDFTDRSAELYGAYDVVLAIDGGLIELAEKTSAEHVLLHVTGSYPPFQNAAERRRLDELRARRGFVCAARRMVEDEATFVRALYRANSCSLLGNEFTISTFPAEIQPKLTPIPANPAVLHRIKSEGEYVPDTREFIWFFGGGAVHKGLDRVLEAFARRPELTLHVVGTIEAEHDFLEAFSTELTTLPNITYHGALDPISDTFVDIALRCVAFIAPSCSEGMSHAAITMLQFGLFPIISRQTGVSLPEAAGVYLDTCTVEEIEAAALDVYDRPDAALAAGIRLTQSRALALNSRERFAAAVQSYLERALE
jgi:glycosyltransferase involved in cell wall biosynthesis